LSHATLQRQPTVLLAEATVGHEGAVVRISDRDPAVLRALDDAGIGLDAVLTVTDAAAASVTVALGDRSHTVPRPAAEAIWVSA
jgi:DtxR family transcriptional regulator, Mn-dependent transcriptional regulator